METCHRRVEETAVGDGPGWYVQDLGEMSDLGLAEFHKGRVHCWCCGDALLVGGGVESRAELARKAEAYDQFISGGTFLQSGPFAKAGTKESSDGN